VHSNDPQDQLRRSIAALAISVVAVAGLAGSARQSPRSHQQVGMDQAQANGDGYEWGMGNPGLSPCSG
jgi:hypothetical protein